MRYALKHFWLVLVAMLPLAVAQPALADEQEAARAYAQTIGERAVAILSNDAAPAAGKRRQLEGLFEQVVDIDWIGRFVLGRHWRTLTPEQQASYAEAYRAFLVSHYTSNFENYSEGTDFEVSKARKLDGGDYQVGMAIKRPQGEPIRTAYRLRPAGDRFKVVDINVEGVSLITTQRSEFNAVVERRGADYLIQQLHNKAVSAQ